MDLTLWGSVVVLVATFVFALIDYVVKPFVLDPLHVHVGEYRETVIRVLALVATAATVILADPQFSSVNSVFGQYGGIIAAIAAAVPLSGKLHDINRWLTAHKNSAEYTALLDEQSWIEWAKFVVAGVEELTTPEDK